VSCRAEIETETCWNEFTDRPLNVLHRKFRNILIRCRHARLLIGITYLLTCLLTYLLIYLLTYSLTPWCRVLLEKLTGLQLVKKFPVFHGTRRFITSLTSVRHLSLSWASPIQSIYSHPTSWRFILIAVTLLTSENLFVFWGQIIVNTFLIHTKGMVVLWVLRRTC